MTKPEISSMKGASIFINLCSLGFNIPCSFEKNGINLFKKLKYDPLELIVPPNSIYSLFLRLNLYFRESQRLR